MKKSVIIFSVLALCILFMLKFCTFHANFTKEMNDPLNDKTVQKIMGEDLKILKPEIDKLIISYNTQNTEYPLKIASKEFSKVASKDILIKTFKDMDNTFGKFYGFQNKLYDFSVSVSYMEEL